VNPAYVASDVRQIIGPLYGSTGWDTALDKCVDILSSNPFVRQSEISGRLEALAMAGQNPEALQAVARAFNVRLDVGQPAPIVEARILPR